MSCNDVADYPAEKIWSDWLGQEVNCSKLHGRHRVRDATMCCHDDHSRLVTQVP